MDAGYHRTQHRTQGRPKRQRQGAKNAKVRQGPRLGVGAEAFDQLGGVDGLGEEFEIVAAGAGAGEDLDRGGLSAEQNDAGCRQELADGDGGFHAIELRQSERMSSGVMRRAASMACVPL
jgi:hypothetical protein